MASETEELNFKFYFILTSLNLKGHIQLVDTNAALEGTLWQNV